MKLFKKRKRLSAAEPPMTLEEASKSVKIYLAYEALIEVNGNKEVTEADRTAAIEEAVGYLGEVLE